MMVQSEDRWESDHPQRMLQVTLVSATGISLGRGDRFCRRESNDVAVGRGAQRRKHQAECEDGESERRDMIHVALYMDKQVHAISPPIEVTAIAGGAQGGAAQPSGDATWGSKTYTFKIDDRKHRVFGALIFRTDPASVHEEHEDRPDDDESEGEDNESSSDSSDDTDDHNDASHSPDAVGANEDGADAEVQGRRMTRKERLKKEKLDHQRIMLKMKEMFSKKDLLAKNNPLPVEKPVDVSRLDGEEMGCVVVGLHSLPLHSERLDWFEFVDVSYLRDYQHKEPPAPTVGGSHSMSSCSPRLQLKLQMTTEVEVKIV